MVPAVIDGGDNVHRIDGWLYTPSVVQIPPSMSSMFLKVWDKHPAYPRKKLR